MGQHTSRSTVERSSPRSPLPHGPLSQAWPRWASSLTQGLPPDGDKGLFRGEFILVQAPFRGTIGRNEESHPRVSHLFRHQFRSHTIALPDTSSTASLTRLHQQGITRVFGPYSTNSSVRGAGPVNLTLHQSRGFTKGLRNELGHITEEEEESFPEEVRQEEKLLQSGTFMRSSNESYLGLRARNNDDGDDEFDDEDYDNDDEDEVSSDDHEGINSNRSISHDEGVPYQYFANHLVKPLFVTSQRYGTFNTMTARKKTPFPLPRANISRSLPRTKKHTNHRIPSRNGWTLTRRNAYAVPDNRRPFERTYMGLNLADRTMNTLTYPKSPMIWRSNNTIGSYDLYNNYTEISSYPSTAKIYDTKRPPSPIQDYSSSESGISDDYGFASKNIKKSSPRNSDAVKTSSSDESNKRRKSSSADSAMRDFDLLSSFSSENGDNNNQDDEVFRGGSFSSRYDATRTELRRISDSSSSSNSSSGRIKGRNSVARRSSKGKRGKVGPSRLGHESRRRNVDKFGDNVAGKTLLRKQKKLYRAAKLLHSENTWPQLKSCLVNDESREMEGVKSLHNDSFLGDNDFRRRSMPYKDLSLDSEYGELNRTARSSRSASHKSVAFADETVDTSVGNTSSKNISKSLADIINTSLTDGTYSALKTFNRSKPTSVIERFEPHNKSGDQIVDQKEEKVENKENHKETPALLVKPAVFQKTSRSTSAESFLSSPNCTDRIKKLQDILIKQALPFAKPDVQLPTQSTRFSKADQTKNNVNQREHSIITLEDSFSTYTHVEEKPPVKQNVWHSKSEGDLATKHTVTSNTCSKHVSDLDTSDNRRSVSATVLSGSQEPAAENLSSGPPPPPPPPAPPLPDFLNKSTNNKKTSPIAEVKDQITEGVKGQIADRQSKNISIIKVNKSR